MPYDAQGNDLLQTNRGTWGYFDQNEDWVESVPVSSGPPQYAPPQVSATSGGQVAPGGGMTGSIWTPYVPQYGGGVEDQGFDFGAIMNPTGAQYGGNWSGPNVPTLMGRINAQGNNGYLFKGSDGYYFNGQKLPIDDATAQAWLRGTAEAIKQERESTNFGTQFDKFGEIAVPIFLATLAAGAGGFGPLAVGEGAAAAGAGAGWIPAEGGAGYAGGAADFGAITGGASTYVPPGGTDIVGSDWAAGDPGSMVSNTNVYVPPTDNVGSDWSSGDTASQVSNTSAPPTTVDNPGSDWSSGDPASQVSNTNPPPPASTTNGSGVTDEQLLTGQNSAATGDLGVGTGTAAGWSGVNLAAPGVLGEIMSLLPDEIKSLLSGLDAKTVMGVIGGILGGTQGQPAPITSTVSRDPAGVAAMQKNIADAQALAAKGVPAAPKLDMTKIAGTTDGAFTNAYVPPPVTAAPTYSNPYTSYNVPTAPTYDNAYKSVNVPTAPTYSSPYVAPTAPTLDKFGNTYTAPNVTAPKEYGTAYDGQFLQAAIQGAIRPMENQYKNVVMPQIGTSSMANGQFGSSRQAIAEALASEKLAQATGDTSAQLMNQFAQQRAANILGTNTLNSQNTNTYNTLLEQIQRSIAAGQTDANTLNSNNALKLYDTGAGVARDQSTAALNTNTLNSDNLWKQIQAAILNSSTSATNQNAANTLNSNNLWNQTQYGITNNQNQATNQTATNTLNSENLWKKTTADITNAGNVASNQNTTNTLNQDNFWKGTAYDYKAQQDAYTNMWNALINSGNIANQAAGGSTTSVTPMPETPWWQTAVAGAGTFADAYAKLFPKT